MGEQQYLYRSARHLSGYSVSDKYFIGVLQEPPILRCFFIANSNDGFWVGVAHPTGRSGEAVGTVPWTRIVSSSLICGRDFIALNAAIFCQSCYSSPGNNPTYQGCQKLFRKNLVSLASWRFRLFFRPMLCHSLIGAVDSLKTRPVLNASSLRGCD